MRIVSVARVMILLAAAASPAAARASAPDAAAAASGQSINISPIAAPIVSNGKLVNYIFVSLRLDLAPNADVSGLRDKEPYFRDALVRAAHKTPFVKKGDFTHIDEAALKASVMASAARIAGPGRVTGVEILDAQPQKAWFPKTGGGGSAQRAPIP